MTARLLGRVVPGAVAEVITGDEEARLSFRGAVGELDPAADLSWSPISVAAPRRWCSATTMACRRPTRPTSVASGSPNVLCTGPTHGRRAGCRNRIRVGEAGSGICRGSRRTGADLGGVAGTMTTLSAIGMGLPEYDSDVIHLSRIAARPELRMRAADRDDEG